MSDVLAPGSPALDSAVDEELRSAVRRLLASTCRSAGLVALEAQLPGELALQVRRRLPLPPRLVVWPTRVPPCAWHPGLLLLATAADDEPSRRRAVTDAGDVLHGLVVAARRRSAAESLAAHAVALAGRDSLTGVGNRRTWREALDAEAARTARYRGPSSIVVVDLDGLKRINDEQGHAAGDAHLRRAAAAVRRGSRTVDVVCRLGGDEFGVLAPETAADGAQQLANRLREELAAAEVAASIGVATAEAGDLEQAWQAADAAMYLHKRSRV
jgi:diguanylate cyclase (GGDEF)-like protein